MKPITALAAASAAMFATVAVAAAPNWLATITRGANGVHTLGNPNAAVKLTEYVSYTCSHCAHFTKTSEMPLKAQYVQPGKVSVTINNYLRNPVDMAVALLANCGDPKKFWTRHHRFFGTQDKWLNIAASTSAAQQARWRVKDRAAAMRAIASDLDLYGLVAPLGIDRAAANRCLADASAQAQITAQHEAAEALGVTGTPSFAINGEHMVGIYDDWPTLDTLIKARLGSR